MSFLPLYNLAKFKNIKDFPKIAQVINNQDPKGLGRIKVSLKGMFDAEDPTGTNLPWIRRMNSEMGIGLEEMNIPAVGDKVEIVWPYDNKHAFYRGIPFGEINKLGNFTDYDWGWATSSGFTILANKSSGAFQIKNSNCKITVSADGELNIETNSNTNINTKGKTNITSESDLTITGKANTTITTTGITTINSTGNASLTGNNVTITGSKITISGNTTIDNKIFLQHTHSNGNDGKPTGGVL